MWRLNSKLKPLLLIFLLGLVAYPLMRMPQSGEPVSESALSEYSTAPTSRVKEEPVVVLETRNSEPTVEPVVEPTRSVVPVLEPDLGTELFDKKIKRDKERFVDVLMKPLIAEALLRRQHRAASDPGYYRRGDPALNAGRVSVLIFVSGETHEPPLEWGIIASPSIVSINYLSTRRCAHGIMPRNKKTTPALFDSL